MKKIICVLTALVLTVGLCACGGGAKPDSSTANDLDPKDVVCRELGAGEWTASAISHGDGDRFIKLDLPSDWVLTESGNGFEVSRNGDSIGTLSRNEADLPDKAYKSKNAAKSGLKGEYRLYLKDGGFRHNYRFLYNDNKGAECTAVLDVKMEELDTFAANRIVDSASLVTPEPFISGDFKLKNDGKRILVIGNSFVASSNIGSILQALMWSKGYVVDAHSRGYATVRTYSDDPEIIASIRDGHYCAVFICGFYEGDSVEALGIIKSACESSNTLPVIFPAHNEQPSVYGAAVARYPDIAMINWRDEIGSLINGGVPTEEMCINDSHQHSTPLAGYVGAHMIYRALFGTVPTQDISNDTGLTQAKLKSVLGDYVRTGDCGYSAQTEVDKTYTLK